MSRREVGVGRVARRDWKRRSGGVVVVVAASRVALRVSCNVAGRRDEASSGSLTTDDSARVEYVCSG